ncbi:MAG: hypothetical protein WCF65_03805 [Parachlamydiaceae bacterium]
MSREGTVILHDVGRGRPCGRTAMLIKEMGYSVVIFDSLGTGVAIIRLDHPNR